jgi:L-iditol 2-dehydrogenase
MRAAFVPEPNRVEVGDFPEPVAQHPGDLVVKMSRASICGSDVHSVYHGFHNPAGLGKPGYPGHEGVGVVVESKSDRFRVGQTVLTVPVGNIGGCFAEYQAIHESQVVELPDGVDEAAILMAQQYGTTLYSMRLFWPQAGNTGMTNGTAAILGAGSAGLFFLQQAKQLGFERILVSDLNEDRLKVAASLGAETVLAPQESIVDAVHGATNGVGADLVIEAAGYDVARADTIRAVRVLGTVGFFGFPEKLGDVPFPMFEAFRKIARIQWAGGTQAEPGLVAFRDAIRHIHEGSIDVSYCLTKSYPLEEAPEAMAVARDQGHGHVKLTIEIGA